MIANRRTARVAISAALGMYMLSIVGCSVSQPGRSDHRDGGVTRVSASIIEQTVEADYEAAAVVVLATVDKQVGPLRVDAPSGDDRAPESTLPWIFTQWSVTPKRIYKSDGFVVAGEPITVALRGGQSGDEVLRYDNEAELAPGEKVLLFLCQTDGPGTAAEGRYFTYGVFTGKYRVDSKTGMAISRDERKNLKFADLEKKLK